MSWLEDIIREAVSRAVTDIRANMQAAGINCTGRTARSLEWRVRTEGRRVIGEVLGRRYFGAVETGSRPARRKGTDEEREEFERALTEWCMMRGFPASGLSGEEYARAAVWLAWYIKRHGSRLWRNGGRKDIITPVVIWMREWVTKRITNADYTEDIFKGYPDWTKS